MHSAIRKRFTSLYYKIITFFGAKPAQKFTTLPEKTLINRRLYRIAMPLSINTLTFYALTVTDSIFIGHYKPNSLDILNTIMMPFMTLNQLIDYMHMGTVIPVAHALGEKNYEKARRFVENGFFVYALVGISFWLFWTFAGSAVYRMITPDPETQQIANSYIKIVAYSYLVQGIGYKGLQALFSSTGFTYPFMISGAVQVVVNMFANRVLIYGDFFFPELGIPGAAWGTLLSSIVGALVMLYYFFQQNHIKPTLKGILTPEKSYAWTTIRMGFPVGIDMMLWGLGGIFLVWMINNTDPSLNRFMFFFITLPEFGFRIYSGYILAVTNLTGKAFGAMDIPKLFRIMKFGLKTTALIASTISLFYLAFPEMIAKVFTTDTETIHTLAKYIPAMILIVVPRAFWEIFNGTLHGMGITVWGIFVQMIGLMMIMLQAYFFIGQLHLGILGICLIYTIDEALRVGFMGGRLLVAKRRITAGKTNI
ncbi:MAG: MATE family efflux transporter [Brevinema sp.]